MAGRPSDFTVEIADLICERIADGESLRAICKDEDMPAKSAVFRWLTLHQGFADQYARARETQADALFDEVLDIADDARNDWMERFGKDDAGWLANGESIQRARLRVDARKWMAGKLRPKKYGEKLEMNVTNSPDQLTDEQLIQRIRQLDETIRPFLAAQGEDGAGSGD